MAGVIAEHPQAAFYLCLPVQWPIYQMTVPGLNRVFRVICGYLTKPLKHTMLVRAVTRIKQNKLHSTSME